MPDMTTFPAEVAALPPDKLLKPIAMTGIGNGSLEITTSSPEARVWFTQGLNLLHDFWDYESSRAFEESVRVDPTCAMCFWGLYQAESFRGENDAWAAAALKQAQKLASHATPAERLYIKASVESEKEKQKRKSHAPSANSKGWTIDGEQVPHVDSKETKVLRKLVAVRPDDLQAKIFLAESLIDGFDKDSKPKPGTREAQAILASILASHPDDSAANHYWIHAQEAGLHPELALPSARKLGALTPTSGHMVHMPGHIFYRIGDYEAGRLSFEASAKADEAYMRAQSVSVDDDWNYVHNLMYLIADLLEAGRLEEATAASAKLTAARGDRGTTLYRGNMRDGIARVDPLLPVALRSADWARASALLDAAHPDPALVNLVNLRNALLDYTRGMAALAAGDTPAAATRSKALDDRLAVLPANAPMHMPGMSATNGPPSKDALAAPLHSFLDVAALELRGALQLAQGKAAESDTTFGKASDAERALGYHEPPFYIRPVGETRGDALLRAGRFADAKFAYQQALKERPNSGFPLYGIAQADVAAKDSAAAVADYRAFLDAWKDADDRLPQVETARRWLDSQTQLANAR
jgi:tetratricopeptide (TPR) repeat protein